MDRKRNTFPRVEALQWAVEMAREWAGLGPSC